MKFATIGHLIDNSHIDNLPKHWVHKDLIFSPELNINGVKGHIAGLKLTAKQVMSLPQEKVRQRILEAAIFLQDEFNVDLIQLGALTTSVTSGGVWLVNQKGYGGFVNHGDSYTSAITCQTVNRALKMFEKKSSDLILSVIGSYGIIGEAVSKILVPQFKHSILIGRRENKLKELGNNLTGSFETTTAIKTKNVDVIITATSHPTALLKSKHLKKNAIIVDVSQPPNLSYNECKKRSDITRIDGGYVDFPKKYHMPVPGMPSGKLYACVVEVIMQAMENEKMHHIGTVELKHLKKTERWAEKYGFTLKNLTNFGIDIVR
jgi:predicted amino acid dehydrogenase